MQDFSKPNGKFVISLDFELMWGVRDLPIKASYAPNINGVWEVIPKTLALFKAYNIKSTIAVVGFLFFKDKKSLEEAVPAHTPSYTDKNLSPYQAYLKGLGSEEAQNRYHFCPELIAEVKAKNAHEIASHTFCHYYCLEEGQTEVEFASDLKAFNEVASKNGIDIQSIIFPRNQYNPEYAATIQKAGIRAYRGNETSWLFSPKTGSERGLVRKIGRFLDRYINLSGHNTYSFAQIANTSPYNIPSSRFLSPYQPKLSVLESLRLQRILSGMTHAAKNKEVFHLWWHPHNFGTHQKENFAFLEKIVAHFTYLNATYGFESATMADLTKLLDQLKQ